MGLNIIILAAGQGKRMCSALPKVLHPLGGKTMLERVIDVAMKLQPQCIQVIYGHGGEVLKQTLPNLPVQWVKQEEQLGTGHAVMQALPQIEDDHQVLVLSGDVPLIQPETLERLLSQSYSPKNGRAPLRLLVTQLEQPTGLGRIIRNTQGAILAVVEEKDADAHQRQINEVYSGIYCAKAADLKRWLPKLSCDNAQQEYYLTEIISMAVNEDASIVSLCAEDSIEVQGVNDRYQLQVLERQWQQRVAKQLLLSGVQIADVSRIDIRGELRCGTDVFIDINTVFEGHVELGEGCRIESNCRLKDVSVGAHSTIFANSVLEKSQLGDGCQVGPFARLRPGTVLGSACKIGNFVETKNIVMGEHSKASHLTYLGDAQIGRNVNIGAGTITCNYDGVNKHQTIIEDEVFVGSDTQFIAPVTIGKNATIGAGSTIRKNVPAGELAVTEGKQKTISGWRRPQKNQ